MGFMKSNGSKLFIGPVVDDVEAITSVADLNTLTGYVEVKGLKDLAAFGDEATAITSNQLSSNRTMKQKGTYDAGTPAFVVDVKEGDAGQAAMQAAFLSDSDYAFYVQFPKKLAAQTHGPRRYFAGQVMSFRENIGTANNAVTATASVGINTTVYRDAAA